MANIKCRHCGNLKVGFHCANMAWHHCGNLKVEKVGESYLYLRGEQTLPPGEQQKCFLSTADDYTNLFRHLVARYPDTAQYDTLAFMPIMVDCTFRDHLFLCQIVISPYLYLYDNHKQQFILEGVVHEVELSDQHIPPLGYRFSSPTDTISESRLTTAHRGIDMLMSVIPNISGRALPKKTAPHLRRAFVYQHYLKQSPKRIAEIKADTKPQYWSFKYAE